MIEWTMRFRYSEVCPMSGDPSSVSGRNALSLWAENGCVASRGSSINGILQGFHQKWAMWQNIHSPTPVIAANSPSLLKNTLLSLSRKQEFIRPSFCSEQKKRKRRNRIKKVKEKMKIDKREE